MLQNPLCSQLPQRPRRKRSDDFSMSFERIFSVLSRRTHIGSETFKDAVHALILDQEVLGSNPSEAALQKHIKEHYVLRYDSRRNVFYFNKIIKHKGNFARFNAGWSQCVLRYSEYTKMAFSGLILSTHLVLTYR